MADRFPSPLFVRNSENELIETEGGGLAATLAPDRGKKRPPSPLTLSGGGGGDDDEWLLSDSEEDEDHEGNEDKGTYLPFTVDDIPRPSCDFQQQSNVMFRNEEARLRGPSPIRLFPAFKSGEHPFNSDYNLSDKSQINVDGVRDCPNECRCSPMVLLQFIDIKIVGYRQTHAGQAKIYGFIAVRETTDPLRNYVYRRGIENCESVSLKQKTGVARLSLTSPARVISMISRALIEFEVHDRNEDETGGNDSLIIEGCAELDNITFKPKPYVEHQRVYGEKCALDIKYMALGNAVEAQVEVTVLRLGVIPGGVNMKLYAKNSSFAEVIRLFQGVPPKPGDMMSFTVAVERHDGLRLYIESSPRGYRPIPGKKLQPYQCWQCVFASGYHGMSEKVVELGEFAAFSVRVTWRSYEKKICG
ncbi:hypothetical protein U9M48_037143 [Paspalum notatum var. saurae]|uniref:DUF6598 domain-containing protein n=1 Tax=Paspalum notatum var. saurae TaxID=547442 RepID=A0AAQ3UED2_PASNO